MKKKYISPIIEEVDLHQQATILAGSYHGYAGSKGLSLDDEDTDSEILNEILGMPL